MVFSYPKYLLVLICLGDLKKKSERPPKTNSQTTSVVAPAVVPTHASTSTEASTSETAPATTAKVIPKKCVKMLAANETLSQKYKDLENDPEELAKWQKLTDSINNGITSHCIHLYMFHICRACPFR